jgi:hypothetical protein
VGGRDAQSPDPNNALVAARDPDTGRAFPGNVIPASRLNPSGQAPLKVFPALNITDRTIPGGRYNDVFQQASETPIRSQTVKLDWNASPRNLVCGGGWNPVHDSASEALPKETGSNG